MRSWTDKDLEQCIKLCRLSKYKQLSWLYWLEAPKYKRAWKPVKCWGDRSGCLAYISRLLQCPSQVQANSGYWSSTTYAPSTSSAWLIYTYSGYPSSGGKTSAYYVWPVRGGSFFDVNIFPSSGKIATTFGFELSLIIPLPPGYGISGGSAILDGTDVTGTLLSCVRTGVLNPPMSGWTLRCPITGAVIGAGSHTFKMTINFSNGTSDSDTVKWDILSNTD